MGTRVLVGGKFIVNLPPMCGDIEFAHQEWALSSAFSQTEC
jgi:hypothetical protein